MEDRKFKITHCPMALKSFLFSISAAYQTSAMPFKAFESDISYLQAVSSRALQIKPFTWLNSLTKRELADG